MRWLPFLPLILPTLAVVRGDAGPTDRFFLGLTVALLIAGPFTALTHELAHGAVAVALTGQRVSVEIGHQPAALRFAVGRIDVFWDPRPGTAYCSLLVHRLSRPQIVGLALAGPLSDSVLAGVLAFAARSQAHPYSVSGVLFWSLAAVYALSAVVNFVPITFVMPLVGGGQIADQANDGMLAWRAVRGHRGVRAWRPAPVAPRVPVAGAPVDRRVNAVLSHAMRAARSTGASSIGTEHVLCGLAHADALSAALLARNGVSVSCRCQTADDPADAPLLPATPRLRKALVRARSSLTLSGSPNIQPEHLLLGLLGDPQCGVAEGLADRADALRSDLISRLAPS